MAGLLTGSFARTGWCAEISGVRSGGVIEDLPIREVRTRSGENGQSPVEHLISEAHQADLANQGIIPLVGRLNTDAAWVLSAPTVHLPERYPDAGETTASLFRSSLPFQMVAGRISQYVGRTAREIGQGRSPEAIRKIFMEALASLLTVSGRAPRDAVEVRVGEDKEHPDSYEVSIFARPDLAGMDGLPPVEMNLCIRK
jgi:type VI secretion system protein ImpC